MLVQTGRVRFAVAVVGILGTLAGLALAQMPGSKQARPLITERIDESVLTTLRGNLRPEATAENDRGPVADSTPMEHLLLQLRRPPEQEAALEALIEQLHNPASANFHHWLTAQEFGERFGPAPADVEAVTNWLASRGFSINVVYPSGMLIDFSGTAGVVQQAFHTPIHHLEVNGAAHMANMGEPQVPAALAAAVVGVVSLHDFMPHTMHRARPQYTLSGGNYALVPADLASIYNLNPLFNAGISGQGQTVVVIEDTNVFSASDWTTFRSTFGLSGFTAGSFTQVQPPPPSGSNNCGAPGTNGDDIEAILDAEWASAAAPSAAIELAACANTNTFGGLLALENLVNGNSPPAVMSVSYGECEVFNGASSNAAYNSAYQQAAAEGVSVFVSAGDEGAASCDAGGSHATHGIGVSGFASTPYNVAVGGTDFGDTYANSNSTYWNSSNTATFGSAKSYIPEIPWNDSCASVLIATFVSGSGITYGTDGFCNSTTGEQNLTTASGSGGPSGCATGSPANNGVVGGTCAGYAKPSWQSVFGNPSDGVRDLPDVSLFAANGVWGHYFVFCDSDINNGGAACTGSPSGWSGAGGTSFSSPIMAGIQALVNQRTGARQGNPNPSYYQLAATEYGSSGSASCNSTLGNGTAGSCIFYDVTQGDMDVNCTGSHNCYRPSGTNGVLSTSNSSYSPAFATTSGWDFATGIGTVNAANLVNNWPTANFTLSANPTSVSITQGAAGKTTTITVNPQNGFSGSVGLSASGLPSGVTASFSPTSTSTTSTLTLTASSAASVGTANITISGTSGSLQNGASLSLTVVASASWSISGTITNGAGATVTLTGASSGSTTANGSGNYSFSGLSNGSYTVTPSLAGGVFSPLSQPVTVSGASVTGVNFTAFSPVAHALWSVAFVDSQETSCYNGAATNAIDGNPSTFWVTQFCGASPGPPHEIQINLGATYSLGAFSYLPRQDGCSNGWINQYQFYVSTDGVNWGSPVAAGNFNYSGLKTTCPGGSVPSAQQVSFTPVNGQYIRLRALSEINGNPWIAAAEINVLGALVTGQTATLSSVSLNPSTVTGGNSVTGTVTLNAPAPLSGALVTLSSSNTAVASVPPSVTVLSGNTSATFQITTTGVIAATQATIGASYNSGNASAILTVNPNLIPHTLWSVAFADSQETSCFNGAASNAIDGNSSTFWVTQFCPSSPSTPHEIQINLGASYTLSAFQYLPRQDGCSNGWINQYQFYVSTDGVNWGTPVASGNFNYSGLKTTCPGGSVPPAQQVNFTPVTGRYIRLRALSEINGNPWIAAAEINALGVASQGSALASISLNPATLLGGAGSTGTVTLTGPAPAGGALVTLSSGNTAVAAVPASVTVLGGNTTANFAITTTPVSAATPVTISGSYNGGNASATLTVNPNLIPHTLWSVAFVDSQETSCYNGAATNAIDGNGSTFWVTQFCPSSAAMPHEIQINLGASYSLSAFQYLPRQDGCSNGWIKQYEFYVSTDGVNWGTAVATGTFNYGSAATGCPGAGVPSALQVNFPATTAHYVRFRALSEVNGNPWAAAAEINVLGE